MHHQVHHVLRLRIKMKVKVQTGHDNHEVIINLKSFNFRLTNLTLKATHSIISSKDLPNIFDPLAIKYIKF